MGPHNSDISQILILVSKKDFSVDFCTTAIAKKSAYPMHAHFDSRYLYAHHILHYFSTQKTKMVAIQPACTLCSSSIIILITAAAAAVVATSGG